MLAFVSALVALASCNDGVVTPEEAEAPVRQDPSAETQPQGTILSSFDDPRPRRGLGTMTARVPGSEAVVEGVRLLSHHVRTVLQDGFARTEIEEEFLNETGRVLEGRYVFALPPGVSLSRLALWVGSTLVEGEIVERERARRIFHGIVEDTVRPRDPALLDWVRGSELSMTIFPIPAKGSRKVVLAYDEALHAEDGRLRYTLPLSLGASRGVPIGDLAISVQVIGDGGEPPAEVATPGWVTHASASGDRVHLDVTATNAVPEKDFVVELAAPASGAPREARVVTFDEGNDKTFATSFVVPADLGTRSIDHGASDRVFVLDVSDSQSSDTLRAQAHVAATIVRSMQPGGRFAVLACDSACEALPAQGLAAATSNAVASLDAWLSTLAPHGSSDLAGAIRDGGQRFDGTRAAQLVVMHDGTASAGELSTQTIAASVAPVLATTPIDLRLFGAGRSLDETLLRGLSTALGAAYEPLAGSRSLEERVAEIGRDLDRPLLVNARVELPAGFGDVRPSSLPSLRLGQTLSLVGKLGTGPMSGVARLSGEIEGEPVEVLVPIQIAADAPPNPLLPRVWAEREMEEVEAEGGPTARARIVALSQKAHVLSRYTSLLVLENDRMFAEFGVIRTTRRPSDQADDAFGAPSALGHDSPLADLSAGMQSGHGASGGSHSVASPSMLRMGECRVSGRLPPESIQRIIRLQSGRFRACYERGLMKNPSLAGRVVTRFVIDRAGQVVSSVNAGSDLPDPEVVACVVRGFTSLDFPEPEGGTVVVTYPFVFSSDGTRPKTPVALWPDIPYVHREPKPRSEDDHWGWPQRRGHWQGGVKVTMLVDHSAEDERWREARGDELRALERSVADAPESRARHDRWVRALMQGGRFERAHEEARRFVELDPDLALARELLAETEAITGGEREALAEVDALAAAAPRSSNAHLRAARAFAAAGDERRACAHLRSLAEIEGTSEARERADRCTEQASTASAASKSTGVFDVRVECEDPSVACPEVAIVTPTGRVISRAAPFGAVPAKGGLGLLLAGTGTYRTLLIGGDPRARGRVALDVYGKRAVFPFDRGERRTIAATHIEEMHTREPRVWVEP